MIVKRPSNFEMPDLKRCDFEDSGIEEDDNGVSVHLKKRRTATLTYGYTQNESNAAMSSSYTEGGSSFGEETESDSKTVAVYSRKTSRGRVPTLPSRFSDCVAGLKKDSKSKFADIESGLHEIYLKRRDNKKNKLEGSNFSPYLVKKEFKEEKLKLPSYKYHPYCQDTEEDGMMNDFLYSKPSINGWNSSAFVANKDYMPVAVPLTSDKCVGRGLRTKVKQKKAIYGPQDFALGDIVWAKSGKRYPAWPAIVIDPMLQAPEAVLSSCIPGAICVMYFGYSKNGKQRVSFSYLYSY